MPNQTTAPVAYRFALSKTHIKCNMFPDLPSTFYFPVYNDLSGSAIKDYLLVFLFLDSIRIFDFPGSAQSD